MQCGTGPRHAAVFELPTHVWALWRPSQAVDGASCRRRPLGSALALLSAVCGARTDVSAMQARSLPACRTLAGSRSIAGAKCLGQAKRVCAGCRARLSCFCHALPCSFMPQDCDCQHRAVWRQQA